MKKILLGVVLLFLLIGCVSNFNSSGFEDDGTQIKTYNNNSVNVTGNFTGNYYYGEMHFHDDGATGHTVVIPGQNEWVNITGFNGTQGVDMTIIFTNGFTFINESNALRCDIAGRYRSWYKVSSGNAGNNQEYQTQLSVNGIRQEITDDHRKIGAAGDVGSYSGGGSFNCNTGDIINLQTKNNDGVADLQVHVATVTLERIGD